MTKNQMACPEGIDFVVLTVFPDAAIRKTSPRGIYELSLTQHGPIFVWSNKEHCWRQAHGWIVKYIKNNPAVKDFSHD